MLSVARYKGEQRESHEGSLMLRLYFGQPETKQFLGEGKVSRWTVDGLQ